MAKLTSLFKTSSLAQIQDITIKSPSDKQILQYDSSISKWTNVNLSSTSGTSTSIPVATTSTLGGIQIGFNTNDASRNYAVKLENEKAYVHVPWENTEYSAGDNSGLSLTDTVFSINKAKVPVLSTAVGDTSGYVYWDTATTSGDWRLSNPQGGVKVIKDSTDITIISESKIILDLNDNTAFPNSTPENPSLSLTLPDYTHFNAGHTIEFFDAASKFDVKNVEISAAIDQRINTSSTNPILLDITYSTIKFIYSGDPAIGWVF